MTYKHTIGERKTAGEAGALAESWRGAGRDGQVVNGRDMVLLIAVVRKPAGGFELRAEAPGCSRRNAAAILRYVAGEFDQQADAAGEPPATWKAPA